ncbi:MAG: DNA-binding response regulator [Clostridiales bacterium GWF2_36_10]|nr:MAG: DNA-binding response regulator [Clostridiales bacterium GWF2_36_10]
MREIINDYFSVKDFSLCEAKNGTEALEILENNEFDIILLDIMMPKTDGLSVCKKVRLKSEVPIIFLTAKSDEDDKLYGYNLGADDYITKPFSLPVLYAKVVALIKRTNGSIINDEINISGIKINTKSQKVTVDDKEVLLTPKEYDLLLCLIKNKDRVMTRDQLLTKVWGFNYFGNDRVVDTQIKKLRAALGDKAVCICTVIKSGYKFKEVQ